MEKINNEKIDKYYKNSYLIIATISLGLFIYILKGLFYLLFDVNINALTSNERLIANLSYDFFTIIISIIFFINNMKSTIDEFKEYLKKFLKGITSIIVYFLMTFLEMFALYAARVDVNSLTIAEKTFFLIPFEILFMAIIALINNKELSKSIKEFKLKNFSEYFKYYILALVLMVFSNAIIHVFDTSSIAPNEEAVRAILKKATIYMTFSACIYAPFCEELIFRQSIRNIIKNKYIFIITSGLIFGGIHVIGNINNLYDIAYIIPYSIPGFIFAYILTKTDNILYPIGFHFFHNTFLIILQIITLFL